MKDGEWVASLTGLMRPPGFPGTDVPGFLVAPLRGLSQASIFLRIKKFCAVAGSADGLRDVFADVVVFGCG